MSLVNQLRDSSRVRGVALMDVGTTVLAALLLMRTRSATSPTAESWRLTLLYVGWALLTGVAAHDWFGVSTVWNRKLLG